MWFGGELYCCMDELFLLGISNNSVVIVGIICQEYAESESLLQCVMCLELYSYWTWLGSVIKFTIVIQM